MENGGRLNVCKMRCKLPQISQTARTLSLYIYIYIYIYTHILYIYIYIYIYICDYVTCVRAGMGALTRCRVAATETQPDFPRRPASTSIVTASTCDPSHPRCRLLFSFYVLFDCLCFVCYCCYPSRPRFCSSPPCALRETLPLMYLILQAAEATLPFLAVITLRTQLPLLWRYVNVSPSLNPPTRYLSSSRLARFAGATNHQPAQKLSRYVRLR